MKKSNGRGDFGGSGISKREAGELIAEMLGTQLWATKRASTLANNSRRDKASPCKTHLVPK